MTVKEIVTEYLKAHGYDGLFANTADFDGCACELDKLIPCEGMAEDCQAGYFTPCDCGNDCDWHIGIKTDTEAIE